MICRKALFLAGLTLCVIHFGFSQTVISANNGSWNHPMTWSGGVIPTLSNATNVIVQHDVTISTNVESHSLSVEGSLQILVGASLTIIPPDGQMSSVSVGGQVDVFGAMVGGDSITYSSSSASMHFRDGSMFHFTGGPKANIPLAQWYPMSTLLVTGFKSAGYISLAYANSWSQSFGSVIYECPSQTAFVDFNGHLRNIQHDLIIRSSNNQAVRFATTQRPVINIGRDFIVEGRSEFWLCTTSDSTTLRIGRNFEYRSTSNGPTYLTTRGRSWLSIEGNLHVDTPGAIRFCSGSTDSTGVRRAAIAVRGNVSIVRGTAIAPAPGRGKIIFEGVEQWGSFPASSWSGVFDYHVLPSSTLHLGESVMAGGGQLYVKGKLGVGSTHAAGAIQLSGGGNILNTGRRNYYRNATIIYESSSPQVIGGGHPSDSTIHVRCVGQQSLGISRGITVKDLFVDGKTIVGADIPITVFGHCNFTDSIRVQGRFSLLFAGTGNQIFSPSGTVVDELVVDKPASTALRLTSPLFVRNTIEIRSQFTHVHSDGNLTLLSEGDRSMTAQVVALPNGSQIQGNVTVQRHIEPEGRIYRYISSPVSNASVAQLKDDFPVTGNFNDPSTGRGINSSAASLFYFDDGSPGGTGWIPFPNSGFAADNYLRPGAGYTAFIRQTERPTVLDVTGLLNQGRIEFPLQFTAAAEESKRGWNLLGNPYPSPIDWGKNEGWERSGGVGSVIAIRDNAAGMFRYFDGEIGNLPSGIIALGQAFWIRTSAGDAKLVIDEQAKTSDIDEFYRREKGHVDYIQLSLSGENSSDQVFLRKRTGSSRSLDDMDAVKLQNDQISLSISLDDSTSVAISAMNEFLQHEEIPVSIKFGSNATPATRHGMFSLHIDAFGVFRDSRIFIRDNYTGLTSETVLDFTITEDNEKLAHRLTLIIESSEDARHAHCRLKPFKCEDTIAEIVVENIAPYRRYKTQIGSLIYGADSVDHHSRVIRIPVPNDRILNIVVLEEFLTGVDTIAVLQIDLSPERLHLLSAIRCPEGDKITLSQPHMPGLFHWADRSVDGAFLISDDTTMWIRHNDAHNEYVVTYFPVYGCAGESLTIRPEKFAEAPLEITRTGTSLTSNYPASWYMGGIVYNRDTVRTIWPVMEATYYAKAFHKGCDLEASYHFIPLEPEVSVTPIPFDNTLTFLVNNGLVTEVVIFSLDGKIVRSEIQVDGVLETQHLQAGVYVLQFVASGKKYRMKVWKQE
jgi:hypothetical protein